VGDTKHIGRKLSKNSHYEHTSLILKLEWEALRVDKGEKTKEIKENTQNF
jgi:hypothetical protein